MNRKRIRELVYQKYDGHCAYCGREIAMEDMQVDHIISRYKTALTTWKISTLFAACVISVRGYTLSSNSVVKYRSRQRRL